MIDIRREPQLTTPKLSDLELAQRNKRFKHWGNYLPLLFRKGEPTLMITAPLNFTSLAIVLVLATISLLKSQKFSGQQLSIYEIILFILLCCLTFYLCFRLWTLNPGIKSSGLPVLGEESLLNNRNYCGQCKIIASAVKNIHHCDSCDVCLEGCRFHSQLFGRCITPININSYTLLMLCLGFLPVLYILV